MIISASRRTDLPRFYSRWLLQRLTSGFCLVPNPCYPAQVHRVDLRPEAVTAIVFWTRYPQPLLRHLDELQNRGYRFIFQITFNQYPQRYEKNAESAAKVLKAFEQLAAKIGRQRIIWRYDPIFFADGLEPSFHLKNLDWIGRQLEGCVERMVISLLDEYRAVRARLQKAECHYPGDPAHQPGLRSFLTDLASIARDHRLVVSSCAEPEDYTDLGIPPGACIDHELLNGLFGLNLRYKKDPSQRTRCLCTQSRDIGLYQTCPAGCVYCYASSRTEAALRYFKNHHAESESLL